MNGLGSVILELRTYIEKNWVENQIQSEKTIPDITGQDVTKVSDISNQDVRNLEDLIGELGESFHEMLFRKIQESGMLESEIYKNANIDRRLFSKIRSNPAYHPRKDTVRALAVALQLSLDDTIELLAKAEYALSPGRKGDLIVKYFIEQGVLNNMTKKNLFKIV